MKIVSMLLIKWPNKYKMHCVGKNSKKKKIYVITTEK